jgi:cytochrome c peroxidase
MKHQQLLTMVAICASVSFHAPLTASAARGPGLTPKEELGKVLFFDSNLSMPAGQACAACHAPETGFTGPLPNVNANGAVYEGAVAGRFGNRKPPTAAYGGDSPLLHYEMGEDLFEGGMFWDGRATGWTLGDPMAEQAQGPFLNPLEQNNASKLAVVEKVAQSSYAQLFRTVWGAGSLDLTPENVPVAYERIARSIAAYERSKEVNPFSSKFDAYLENKAKLSKMEKEGFRLFLTKGKCANCHIVTPGKSSEKPLFTDFTYDNLGIPKNPENPFYTSAFNPAGDDWIDLGLGGFLATVPEYAAFALENMGKQKVPTLRNVDKRPYPGFVKAYGHNGYFKSLKEIVHFYNTRDLPGANWPAAEVPDTVNHTELGNLGLTDAEEDAIVAFLQTLSDGYED